MSTKTDTNPTFQELERLKSYANEQRSIIACLLRRLGGTCSIDRGIQLEMYRAEIFVSVSEDGRLLNLSLKPNAAD